MQRNTGYFPTESLEPSGNRLFSRSALNEGDLFRGSLGLNSCWVAMTHGKSQADVRKGEKQICLIAFGHGETQGAPHKNKPLQAVCNRTENMPEWFLNGMEAALLAPTAMNQQKFFFELFSDSKVNAVCGKGFYTKLDLGIVKYHFEIASGRKLQS